MPGQASETGKKPALAVMYPTYLLIFVSVFYWRQILELIPSEFFFPTFRALFKLYMCTML